MFTFPDIHTQVKDALGQGTFLLHEQINHELIAREHYNYEVLTLLERVTTEFLLTGIATLPWPGPLIPVVAGRLRSFDWIDYCKLLAYQLKRPHVIVTLYGSPEQAAVHIQRLTRMLPVAARFFLLEGQNHKQHTTRTWHFHLHDAAALELLGTWREACATEPELRRALRLP